MTNTNQTIPRFTVDPMHTTVAFSVRHLMINDVHGTFLVQRGSAHYDPQRPAHTDVEIELAAASVDTRQAQRDAHLRSPEFFSAEAHPTITFRSTRIDVADGRVAKIVGALTIRDITREVVLTVDEVSDERRDFNGKPRVGASATTTIRRSEFGMTFNRVLEYGVALSDDVKLRLDVSLLRDDA